jgi:hypothetical protein
MREKKKSKQANKNEAAKDRRLDDLRHNPLDNKSEFAKWLQENLFTDFAIFFDSKIFPSEVVLYSRQPVVRVSEHLQRMQELFTREDLYRAVMKACDVHGRERNALWFHVNLIDQAIWELDDYKKYPYPLPHSERPLSTLFWRLEKHPAAERGTTSVGLLSQDKKWLLLIEHGADSYYTGREEADFKIRFCGSEDLCKTVRSFLKTKAA